MNQFTTISSTLESWLQSPQPPGTYTLSEPLDDTLTAHANVAVRDSADSIIVFLPGAQDSKSARRVPFFHRWTWQEDFPDSHIVALGDPAIALDERVRGGWFMHRDLDLVAALSTIVEKIATALKVSPECVTFHGSSLGGFGAIGMAAHFRGSRAISEIPQVDVERWKIKSAIELLEEVIAVPLSELRKHHPERVELIARLRYARVVPPLTLITNPGDPGFKMQHEFVTALTDLSSECTVIGRQEIVVSDEPLGHKALPKHRIIEMLRSSSRDHHS